jgi:hypothetical protein
MCKSNGIVKTSVFQALILKLIASTPEDAFLLLFSG